MVRLLRDWQRFGIRDVMFDRKDNTINARVDKVNRKFAFSHTFLSSTRSLDGSCFNVDVLKMERVIRSNYVSFYERILGLSKYCTLTRLLHRPQNQASLVRRRALRCTGAWATSEALFGPIHPDAWRSIKLPQGCGYRRRCLPGQVHACRGSRKAEHDDGGALLGACDWSCKFTPTRSGFKNSWWYDIPR